MIWILRHEIETSGKDFATNFRKEYPDSEIVAENTNPTYFYVIENNTSKRIKGFETTLKWKNDFSFSVILESWRKFSNNIFV